MNEENKYSIKALQNKTTGEALTIALGYMGDLRKLTTDVKTDLVSSLNELHAKEGVAESVYNADKSAVIPIDNTTFTANFVLAVNGDATGSLWRALPSAAGGVVKTVDATKGLTFSSEGALGSIQIGDANSIKTVAISETAATDLQILQYNDTDKTWNPIDLPAGNTYTGTNPIVVAGSVISLKYDTASLDVDADKGIIVKDVSNANVQYTDPNIG